MDEISIVIVNLQFEVVYTLAWLGKTEDDVRLDQQWKLKGIRLSKGTKTARHIPLSEST